MPPSYTALANIYHSKVLYIVKTRGILTSIRVRDTWLEQGLSPLDWPSEAIKAGTHVGIDAEFVLLQREEIELRPGDTRVTARPTRSGLARVSVLRGEDYFQSSPNQLQVPGHSKSLSQDSMESAGMSFTPFADDYIQVNEPIVDYLTTYSGIFPGDLNPHTSPYASSFRLVSLKTVYRKLWLLLNLGCIFVGHGLAKDFRIINLHVPKAQVVDTAKLFLRGQRPLKLQFLSWYLLGERVQFEADGQGHDSVEDARMALRLWMRWRELESRGRTQKTIDDIYRKGRDTGFRLPGALSPPQRNSAMLSGRATPSSEMDENRSMPGTPLGRD